MELIDRVGFRRKAEKTNERTPFKGGLVCLCFCEQVEYNQNNKKFIIMINIFILFRTSRWHYGTWPGNRRHQLVDDDILPLLSCRLQMGLVLLLRQTVI